MAGVAGGDRPFPPGGDRPFPPGDYPVVVVGSGPGGLQVGHELHRLTVLHAVLSADDRPAGMFQRFPLFQRLISWSKLHAPVDRGTREYERYDWNSLISDRADLRAMVPRFMDGTSYFPSRAEMERGIAAFAEAAGVRVRYGCRWEATRPVEDGPGFVLSTSDGEYRCRVAVFAVGTTQPWKPSIPGLEDVPHYVSTRSPKDYADRRVVIIGKRNSGFELADGLLPWARQIVLVSPRPAQLSVITRSLVGARARYAQPYEDAVLGGGNFLLDAAIDRVERMAGGYRVLARGTTQPGDLRLEADEVIAATGFTTPLQDLPGLGVRTFNQGRLPVQSPYWESTVPGIYFAGSVTQGAAGMKKYGIPSNSAAVQGFRYNARVLAVHIARTLGVEVPVSPLHRDQVVPFLAGEAARAPELWHQRSYLARVVSARPDRRFVDEGVVPLARFVDQGGPDAVAVTVESDDRGDIHPAVYLRRDGRVDEHILSSDTLLEFDTPGHRSELAGLLKGFLGSAG